MTDYGLYARTYDREFGVFTGDVPFYLRLARETGGPVLDLGVGTGRVALPLAREGIAVVGVDNSPEMLTALRENLDREPGLPVAAVEGDLRSFDVAEKGPFPLAVCAARTFLHLLTPADQLAALSRVRRHLADGGVFAGSVFRPRAEALAELDGRWSPWQWAHDYRHPDTGRPVRVSASARVDLRRTIYRTRFREEELDPGGAVVGTRVREITLTWIWPRELEHLLRRAGFDDVAVYGDFEGTPCAEGGGELAWVARPAPPRFGESDVDEEEFALD